MTDLMIRRHTVNAASLDDVMRTLYNDFGRKGRGYTDHDYLSVVESIAGKSVADFFLDHVYGTEDYEPELTQLLSFAGCRLESKPAKEEQERMFGFKTAVEKGVTVCTAVMPGSPAWKAGLGRSFEIVAVNEIKVEENLSAILHEFHREKIILTVLSPMKMLRDIPLIPTDAEFYSRYMLRRQPQAGRDRKCISLNRGKQLRKFPR
jgi:predicted metalloprotease with PDZ domain